MPISMYQPITQTHSSVGANFSLSDAWKMNWDQLVDQNDTAKRLGQLRGRVVRHSYADGFAFYQVIKVNKKTVRIRVCKELGDDWVLPAWGNETSLPIDLLHMFLMP